MSKNTVQKVERHELKNPQMFGMLLDNFYAELENNLNAFQERPQNLGFFFEEVMKNIGYATAIGKSNDELIDLYQLANELGTAIFVSYAGVDGAQAISFKGKKYSFEVKLSTAYVDCLTWNKSFYLAIILRDKEKINTLRSVPGEVFRNADVKGDEFDYKFIDFMKGLYDQNVNIGNLLIETMDASDPGDLPESRHDYVLEIKVPELTLYRCFLSNEPEEFNEKLEKALNDHKYYWSKKDRALDSKGWISLPITAACVVAFGSKDFPINVESDYLPAWLVEGDF